MLMSESNSVVLIAFPRCVIARLLCSCCNRQDAVISQLQAWVHLPGLFGRPGWSGLHLHLPDQHYHQRAAWPPGHATGAHAVTADYRLLATCSLSRLCCAMCSRAAAHRQQFVGASYTLRWARALHRSSATALLSWCAVAQVHCAPRCSRSRPNTCLRHTLYALLSVPALLHAVHVDLPGGLGPCVS